MCFSLHMDRLWRKAPSFAANRATRALKLPLNGHKESQAAAAGGLTSETDGLGRKESGFGNGQQDRGVGARVRARGVHGAGQRARARALLPVPGEGGGLAPASSTGSTASRSARWRWPWRPPSPPASPWCSRGSWPRRGRHRFSTAVRGGPRPAGRARSRYRLSSRSTRADSGTGPNGLCLFHPTHQHTYACTHMRIYATAHFRFYVFVRLRICTFG